MEREGLERRDGPFRSIGTEVERRDGPFRSIFSLMAERRDGPFRSIFSLWNGGTVLFVSSSASG